jgi:hypothetical protein
VNCIVDFMALLERHAGILGRLDSNQCYKRSCSCIIFLRMNQDMIFTRCNLIFPAAGRVFILLTGSGVIFNVPSFLQHVSVVLSYISSNSFNPSVAILEFWQRRLLNSITYFGIYSNKHCSDGQCGQHFFKY